jgi:beta-phosphoglucomutase-like phosphatase (HAD superfamily)
MIMRVSGSYIRTRILIRYMKGCRCLKAVVSGSSKEEIETVLDENIGSNNFDFVISGDDLKEGQGKRLHL